MFVKEIQKTPKLKMSSARLRRGVKKKRAAAAKRRHKTGGAGKPLRKARKARENVLNKKATPNKS